MTSSILPPAGLCVRGWVVTCDATLRDVLRTRQVEVAYLASDALTQNLDLSPKDLKRFDRQSLLLQQVLLLAGVRGWPPELRERIPVHVAVGPAQTDLQALRRWASRVDQTGPLPMVQPAQAVGLLPNTPLSLLSISHDLHGESGVWAGLAEAGCQALMAGVLSMTTDNIDQVLILAVSNPDNFFVRQVWRRGYVPEPSAMLEVAVALRITRAPDEGVRWRGFRSDPAAAPALTGAGAALQTGSATGGFETEFAALPDALTATPALALACLASVPGRALVPTPDGRVWEFTTGDRG